MSTHSAGEPAAERSNETIELVDGRFLLGRPSPEGRWQLSFYLRSIYATVFLTDRELAELAELLEPYVRRAPDQQPGTAS